eukprot:365627-Chlamydomonas_euryale.AAC.4
MDITPPDHILHRVNRPLVWKPQPGPAQPDGQVEDDKLLPQPRKPGKYMGVSLFAHDCEQHELDAAHESRGRAQFGCYVSVPRTRLPPGLRLVNDHVFTLRLFGEKQRRRIGQHYVLYVTEEMPIGAFEERYTELMRSFQQCQMSANDATSLTSLIDPHVIPGDSRSAMAVQALEMLAKRTSDPNTELFATLFALDMRACNTDFEEVLDGCDSRA